MERLTSTRNAGSVPISQDRQSAKARAAAASKGTGSLKQFKLRVQCALLQWSLPNGGKKGYERWEYRKLGKYTLTV